MAEECGHTVIWWDGEYEGECDRPKGHEGAHSDGLSHWDDDGEDLTAEVKRRGSVAEVDRAVIAGRLANEQTEVPRLSDEERARIARMEPDDGEALLSLIVSLQGAGPAHLNQPGMYGDLIDAAERYCA